MKQLRYLDMYHDVQEKFKLHTAWLYDESETWGLGIRMAREDSVELALFNKQDSPSILDALGATTLPFIHQLLAATRTRVQRIELRVLPQFPDAWYGAITLENAQGAFELTARKGLMIALALRTHCPLLIADELLEEKGTRLPAGMALRDWLAQPEQTKHYEPIVRRGLPSQTGLPDPQGSTQYYPLAPLDEEQRRRVLDELRKHVTPEEKEKLRQLWQTNPELRQRNSDMWKKLGFAGPPFPEEQMNEESGGNEDAPFS